MSDGIQYIGRILIIFGVFIIIVGVLLLLSDRIPMIGKLPGDIIIQKKNFTFYFPIVTSIILSIILTLIFWLVWRK